MTTPSNRKLSLQWIDDKDVFDLLMSNRRQPSDEGLRRIARKRGIVLSPQSPRHELAKYLSRLTYSYPQLVELLEGSSRAAPRPKTQSMEIDCTVADATKALEDTKAQRESERAEVFNISVRGKMVVVSVNYRVFDWGRTRLRQVSAAVCNIELEPLDKQRLSIRYDDDERAQEIVEDMMLRFDDVAVVSSRKVISLQSVLEPDQRTQFFVALMNGIEGLVLEDVTKMSTRRVPVTAMNASNDDDEAARKPDEGALLGAVRKAKYEGSDLLNTKEFKSLKKTEFFVSHTVWTSTTAPTAKGPALRAEFEATFLDGEVCSQFAYRIRGVYRKATEDGAEFNKTRQPATDEERTGLIRRLENAARAAHDGLEAGTAKAT